MATATQEAKGVVEKELKKLIGYDVQVNVNEVKRPGIVAKLVGQNIAQQLVKKVNYRRAVKKSIQTTIHRLKKIQKLKE